MVSEQTPEDRPDDIIAGTGTGTGTTEDPAAAAPRRRIGRLPTVAAVTAAVLLAGGGSVWWATADGRPAAPGAVSSDGASVEPLRLDGAGVPGAAGAAQDGPAQIAPGEPAPNGGVFRATVDLPRGPKSAHVHTTAATVTKEDVTALARALDMVGTPRLADGVWSLVDERGRGPSLQVAERTPGNWTLSRPGASGGAPVSAAEAKRAAAPLLKALGLEGAELDTGTTAGAIRTVTAAPEVGGLPTQGWETGVQVDPDGRVVGAHGLLARVREKPGAYPVISAEDALKRLNAAGSGSDLGIASCPSGTPADPGKPRRPGSTEIAPCVPSKAPVQEVRGARFGLSAQSVDGRPALVPSWLFDVAQPGVSRTHPVAQVAVDPRYVDSSGRQGPSTPVEGGGTAGTGEESSDVSATSYSYSAKGRTLALEFWGGVCSTYRATAKETAERVTVRITGTPDEPGRACIMIAERASVKVELDKPLGDRPVVDAVSGERIAEK